MKIEILFPELCNLFGDSATVEFLKQTLPEAEFIETHLNDELRFLSEKMNLVYMGPMTENTQELIIEKFRPLKDKIMAEIENDTVFFFTGNALEVMGDYILTDEGEKIPALGLFRYYAQRDMFHRHNSAFLGVFEGKEVMGFKSQFTTCYPENDDNAFIKTIKKGMGMNLKSTGEGYRFHNFIGTHLIGPVLILNPHLARYILKLMGSDAELAFSDVVEAAYEKRLEDFYARIPDKVTKYRYM